MTHIPSDSRFKSIGGILERKDRAHHPGAIPDEAPLADDAGADPPSNDDARAVLARNPAKPSARGPRTGASQASDGGARRVAIRLDPDLHHQLLQAKDARHLPNIAEVVLAALEGVHARGELAAQFSHPANTQLFPRLPSRESAQPKVLVELRLHSKALAALDQLVIEAGARTRTDLIVAALRAELMPRSTGQPATGS